MTKTTTSRTLQNGNDLLLTQFAELPSDTIIGEKQLAKMLGCHPATLRRMRKRGELPEPVRWYGGNVWTVGVIIRHLETRLEKAAKEARRAKQRLPQLCS